MADEIINKLGLSVEDALGALQRLDAALESSGSAFQTFGAALDNWNSQAGSAVAQMKAMASAAGQMADAMSRAGGTSLPTAQTASASTGFWLPPGMEAETQRLNDALKTVGTTATDTGGKIKDAGNTGAAGIADADDKTSKFVVTWGTLSRVVMTQLIVRAMSQIRDALREAVEQSIEFQRRIAEVQTIAPQIGGGFASLTSEVAEFAKQFNIPLKEATEGLYQTLSNQFTAMSQRTDIMTASMKLAKVGVMDFHDAILLVTGTLNAYGLSSDQAESVAAKFFTTIQMGRVRGQELAAVMGQVTPIASELGIGLEQLNSAMVGLTIGGLDAHKAATGLRGAMMALLKPSQDMQKVIRELGYASGEQMVQAKGFQGALQAVADAADNLGSKIAKDVPNVRALTAELRLTQTGAKQVEDAMKAMATSTPDTLDKVYKQFTSTDSEKLTSTINKLKIDLTQDFGAGLTHALASMMQLVGGADNLSAAIQALVPVAGAAAAGLMLLAGAAVVTHIALGPVGWALTAVAAAAAVAMGGMSYFTASSINETRRLSNEQTQASQTYLHNKEEELRVLRETEEKKTAEENRGWQERAAAIQRNYFKALDDLKDKNKQLIDSDRAVMQSMLGSQERVVAAYRNAANAALKIVQDSEKRRADMSGTADDLLFKRWLDKGIQASDQFKMQMDLQRATELRDAANTKLATATTAVDVGRADALRQRADAFEKEGVALAKELGDTFQIEQAEKRVISNVQDQIAAEKQLETLQAKRAQTLADTAAKEQQRLDTMKTLMKAILADLDAFDKKGEKSPQALAGQQQRLTDNLAKFKDQWMGGQKVDVADLLSFDQLQRRVNVALEGGVSKAQVDQLFSTPETFAKFREEISKGVGPVQIAVTMARIGGGEASWKATSGMTASETMAHYEQELQRPTQIINSFKASQDALKVANDGVQQSQGQVQSALDRWVSVGFVKDVRDLGGIWEQFTGHVASTPVVKQAREELVRATLKFTAPNAQPLKEDLDKLQAAYDLYLAVLKPGAASKTALDEFMKKASGMVSVAQQVQTIAAGLKANEANVNAATQEQSAIQNALKAAADAAAKAKQSTDATQTGAEAAGKALSQVSQINMSALLGQTQQLADAMWNLAQASQNVVQAPAARMTAAQGGVAWKFLAGGGPVGTDTIPAMLSPGEVVINAASARNFASQLTAINAGVRPVYRSEGGSVTNIGDINVSVTGGGTGRQTARSIAAELRRELRRGTATL